MLSPATEPAVLVLPCTTSAALAKDGVFISAASPFGFSCIFVYMSLLALSSSMARSSCFLSRAARSSGVSIPLRFLYLSQLCLSGMR